MVLIICLDDRNGTAFNHRRQSRDSEMIWRIAGMARRGRLIINPYSATIFPETEGITVCDSFDGAGEEDICFAEREVPGKLDGVEKIIVYRWNRVYPADRHFSPEEAGFRMTSASDFAGKSHERITEEIWERE